MTYCTLLDLAHLSLARLDLADVAFIRTRRALSTCLLFSALLSLSLLFSAPAHATGVPIPYADLVGTDATYTNIVEHSATDPGPLFGAPSVSGNQLEFNPTAAFEATSSGGGPPDITDGQLNFEVVAHAGKVIDSFMLMESGVFTLSGVGTAATSVSVSTPTFITITELDGVPFAGPTIATNMVFVPVGNTPFPFGNYNLTTHLGTNIAWNGALMADITQKLVDEGIDFDFGATKIEVVLNNTLTALSETGTSAEISKGDFDQIIIVTNIPEPATCGLAIVGLLAAASVRCRMSY